MRNSFKVSLSLAGLFIGASTVHAQEANLTIGSIMPLSGPAATYGESFTNVIPLAVDALKSEGISLKVISEDGAADVPTSIAAYNKLVQIDKVPAIVLAVSPVVLTLGPMADRDQVVMVNSMAGAPQIATLGDYNFSTMPSYQIEGIDAARFAYESGARKIFGMYQDTEAGKAAWDVFRPEFERLGGEIVGEEGYRAGATEYRAQLTRAERTAPDWIYLSSYAAETGRILAQAQRMALTSKVQFLGIVGAAQAETISLGGEGAEGFVHASWPFDPENGSEAMKEFGKAYSDRYGALPSVYAATSYDSIMAIAHAVKSGATTGPEIRQFFAEELGEFSGVSGDWAFDEKGLVVLQTSFVKIENGVRELVK